MAEDFIRYDVLIQDAMRGLVRTVLKDAAVRGLPGEHHFFISFDTRHPGVKLSLAHARAICRGNDDRSATSVLGPESHRRWV